MLSVLLMTVFIAWMSILCGLVAFILFMHARRMVLHELRGQEQRAAAAAGTGGKGGTGGTGGKGSTPAIAPSKSGRRKPWQSSAAPVR